MIGFAAERLTALETEERCDVAPGERGAERRNQRNGYRNRDWQTRAGTVELRVPKPPPWQLLPRLRGARRMATEPCDGCDPGGLSPGRLQPLGG
jgi:putative transposase